MSSHGGNTESIAEQSLFPSPAMFIPPGTTKLEDDCCVICLDHVSEQAFAQPCNHGHFDFICLITWLQSRSTCPLCKGAVTTVRHKASQSGAISIYAVPPTNLKQPSPTRLPRRSYLPRHERPHRSFQHLQSSPTIDEALERRRLVYRHSLFSLHVGTNRLSSFTDLTPSLFASSSILISRARTWIRRELRVFSFLDPNIVTPSLGSLDRDGRGINDRRANNAEFLLEYIIAILKSVDLQGSQGEAKEMLVTFLGRDHTNLFLHELRAWLRSPYMKLEDWDRHVQYGVPGKGEEGVLGSGEGRVEQETSNSQSGYVRRRMGPGKVKDRFRPYGRCRTLDEG